MNLLPLILFFTLFTLPVSAEQERLNENSQGNPLPPKTNKEIDQIQELKEEVQIQIMERDGEGLEKSKDKAMDIIQEARADKAQEHMSNVAKKVKELMKNKENYVGMGKEISEFAQKQNESQERIEKQHQKLERRAAWIKRILGPNREAIQKIKQEIDQNKVRLEELQELEEEASTLEQKEELSALREAIVDQNQSLTNKVSQEESVKGIFGLIVNLFN